MRFAHVDAVPLEPIARQDLLVARVELSVIGEVVDSGGGCRCGRAAACLRRGARHPSIPSTPATSKIVIERPKDTNDERLKGYQL